MSYKEALKHLPNVAVINYSPRLPGTPKTFSTFYEIINLPHSYKDRVACINTYAQWNKDVFVKPATYGEQLRVWVRI